MFPTSTLASTPRHHRRLAQVAILLMVVGVLGTVAVSVHEALAANATRGVKYVEFKARPDACLEDNALPCLPAAGAGSPSRPPGEPNGPPQAGSAAVPPPVVVAP